MLGVVVFTRLFRISDKDGIPIRDNVLIMEFNPKNLKGEFIKLYEYNMVFLNASKKNRSNETPKKYQDWLDLLYVSMKQPKDYSLNLQNKGIAKAFKLIDFDYLDPVTLREMKEAEMRKEMDLLNLNEGVLKGEKIGIKKGKVEVALNMLKNNFPIETIKLAIGFTLPQINIIKTGVENNRSVEEIMKNLKE